MKPRRNLFLGTLVVIALSQAATADTYNWIGGNGTWDTTTANWTGAGTTWPAASTTNDDAVFGGTAGTVTIATGGVTANDLTFNTTGYTIGGAALTLDGGPVITSGSGITATISSVISGSAGLTKAGDGILVLSGANNFTGVTTISAGTLRTGNGAALGSNVDGTTVASGAALDVNGQNLGTEVVTVSGTGIGGDGAIVNSGAQQINAFGRLVLAGNTTFGGPNRWDLRNSTPTFDMGGFTLTKTSANYIGLIGAAVSNPGNFIVNQGELSITLGTNLNGSATNIATVNNGGILSFYQSSVAPTWTLNLNTGSILRGENGTGTQNTWAGPVNVAGEVTLQADGVLTLSNTVTGTANLTKTGGSTATISGSLAHTGTTTLIGGTLALDYTTADTSKLPDGQVLTLAGGTISLANGTHTEEVLSTTLAANTASSVSSSSHSGYLQLNAITCQSGASVDFNAGSIATTDTLNTNGILGPWATVAGNDWAANDTDSADGEIVVFADYVFTTDPGLLDDADGYLNQHVIVDSTQTPGAAISPLSLIFNSAAANTLTLQGTNTIATGGILGGASVGANAAVITGGNLTGPNNGDLVINQRNTTSGGSFTIGSTITNNGTTNLLKLGIGTAILDAANSYTGTTTINAGSLQINNAAAIGGTQVVTSATNNASLVLNDGLTAGSGKTITIAGGGASAFFGALSTNGSATWEGNVVVGAATGSRIGTLGSGTLTVTGNITEPVPSELILRPNTGGTIVLTGSSTRTGSNSIVTGTLRVGSDTALGSGGFNFLGTATLSSDGATARTLANPIILSANPTLGDATNNGKLTFSNTFDLGAAARTVATASEVEISGTLTGSGSLTKTGAANLILSGNNTHTGSTIVSGGRIIVSHPNGLGTTAGNTRINTGGTLELATDSPIAVEALDMGSGNTGTLVLNRATAGNAVNHVFAANTTLGNANLTIEAGPNVTSGTPVASFNGILLTAGSSGTLTLSPTTAAVAVTGPISSTSNFAKVLGLAGSNTNNVISGVISNGTNTVSVTKSGTSIWELSGENTYSGTTIVREGTLILSGNRANNGIGAVTVGDTAGLNATLNISNGTHNLGTGQMNVGNAPTTPITGTVNQSGGSVIFAAGGGNQLLVGQNTVTNQGIYNLSGGSLTIGLSTNAGRGVMLGVNTGAFGGTFNLSGTGVLNMTAASGGTGDANLAIGRFDSSANNTTNTFNQSGGTANVGVLSMGGNGGTSTGVSSTLSLTGGVFSANQFPRLAAGNSNTAVITIGGTADVTLPAFPTTRGTSATATLNFNGGVLKPKATSTAYIGGLTNAYIKSGGAKFNTNGFDITVSQNLLTDPVSTGGGLTKEGSGTLSLTGVNTYTGNTTVTAGTLSLGDGTANTGLDDNSDVTVAGGATLNLNFSAANVDTVDTLTINGVQKAAGIWGAPASGAPNTDAQITGAGYLNVQNGPSASDYDNWMALYPSITDPNDKLPGADPDGDGLTNQEEYAFGLAPDSGSSVNPILVQLNKTAATFTYQRRSSTGLTYTIWTSPDLVAWTEDTTAVQTPGTPDGNNVQSVAVTLTGAPLTATKLFVRVKAAP